MEQAAIDRRNELYRKPGLTKAEQDEFRTLDDAFWIADVKVGAVGVLRFIALNNMRVEVLVVGETIKIKFHDHYDDGSSHAILSAEQMEQVIEFYNRSIRW